jgi:hypothetical protein
MWSTRTATTPTAPTGPMCSTDLTRGAASRSLLCRRSSQIGNSDPKGYGSAERLRARGERTV